jgi:C1A family cysteine protease
MKKTFKLIVLFVLVLSLLSGCSNGDNLVGDSGITDTGSNSNVIISTEGSGEVTKDEQDQTTTKLMAAAAEGHDFSHWEGDLSGTNNPEYIDNTSRKEVIAVFVAEGESNTGETDENGVFKLINSWGENWGPFNDGSYYISYEAAIANNLDLYLIEPRDQYQPQALAVFEIEAASRENVGISFETAEGAKKLYPTAAPYDYDGSMNYIAVNQKAGDSAFPGNNLALDITSLLPIGGEITLTINNSGSTDIYLNNWEIEEYENYPGDPINSYSSNFSSEKIEASSSKSFTMNITVESSFSAQALSSSGLDRFVRDYTEADWRSRKEKNIRAQSKKGNSDADFGRGLKELSAAEMRDALESGLVKTIDSSSLSDGEIKVAGEANLDYSNSEYFPPVGNQGTEGSCASWSTVYYMLGYYQARDQGWDLSASSVSGVDQSQLMSPDFIYQLINDGQNGGTYYTDNLMMLANLGAASWAEMPTDDSDYLSWGNEDAWRKAAANRVDYPIYYIQINNYTDIAAVKDLLDQGYLLSTAIDSTKYSDSGIWTVDNYSDPYLDHANTVVGYDDGYQSSVDEISIK